MTGSERAFAAGADIKEMENASGVDMLLNEPFAEWSRFAAVRTPVIAAVSGYALGGGCELVMMCDIVLADPDAKFGQPEINLAVIPGMGGTQRLVRAIGYYKAAELVLTGRIIDAQEAERIGLVSRVVSPATCCSTRSGPRTRSPRSPCRRYTQPRPRWTPRWNPRSPRGCASSRAPSGRSSTPLDQKEGMAAFREKRSPAFQHR